MIKKFLLVILAFLIPNLASAKEDVDWLIYLYLVGSDLESDGGSATNDISEIIDAEIHDNIKMVIMTGGAKEWMNENVNPKKIQIFETNEGDLELAAEYPRKNMGDPNTLKILLEHGEKKYNPKKRMIIFWNHGGGPTGGVGYDELADDDALTMPEIQKAFQAVFQPNQPFDLIGFDACLMAHTDSAYYMSPWGKYMVASEETEPSLGWYYTGWLSALNHKPSMNGAELGTSIADTFLAECKNNDMEDVTLSVIDLNKYIEVALNFSIFGGDYLEKIQDVGGNPLVSNLAQAAKKSERYGAQSNKDSIDLHDLISNMNKYVSNDIKQDLLKSIEKAVIYKVNGDARNSKGIAVYYPLSHDKDDYKNVLKNGMANPLLYLNGMSLGGMDQKSVTSLFDRYEQTYDELVNRFETLEPGDTSSSGETTGFAKQELSKEEFTNVKPIETNLSELDLKVNFDKNYNSYIKIPEKYLDQIESVDFILAVLEAPTENEDGYIAFIGTDDSIKEDWDKGIFTDQFQNSWPHFGDNLLPSIYVSASGNVSRYNSHIKVNGVDATLEFIYNYDTETYKLVNIIKNNADGLPSRTNIKLKDGDEITTILSGLSLNENDKEQDPIEFDFEKFKYKSDMKITQESLGTNTTYALILRATSTNGTVSEADPIIINVGDDDSDLEVMTWDEYEQSQTNENNSGEDKPSEA